MTLPSTHSSWAVLLLADLALQIAFYALALIAYVAERTHRPPHMLSIPFTFYLVNLAALWGGAVSNWGEGGTVGASAALEWLRMNHTAKIRSLEAFIRRHRFIPACFFSFLLWIVASLPGSDLQRIQTSPESALLRFILSDPCMHFLTFGLLTLLICAGFSRESDRSIPLLKVGALASGCGLLIEIYQHILPWRAFGLDDVLWNVVGVIFSLAVIWWQLSRRGWAARRFAGLRASMPDPRREQ